MRVRKKTRDRLHSIKPWISMVVDIFAKRVDKNPERYPTLMVRVAGYSAYFVDLCEEVQNDIISRTEHEL